MTGVPSSQLMRSARRGLAAGTMLLAGAVLRCGAVAQSVPVVPTYDAGLAKCHVAASRTEPLVTEWPAPEKSHLQAIAATRAVAVAYSGCELKIIDECHIEKAYAWQATTPATDTINITNEDDLYAKLPLGALGLEGELKRSGRLTVRTTVSGQLRLDAVDMSAIPREGPCSEATHVIASISVGAFKMLSGGGSNTRAGVGVGNAGLGGAGAHDEETLHEAGDPNACAVTGAATPPQNCASPIQVFLMPIIGARSDGAAVLFGQTPSGAWLSSAEMFDAATSRWVTLPDDPVAHGCGASAFRISAGHILVAGGGGSHGCADDGATTNRVRILDVPNRSWTAPNCQAPCVRLDDATWTQAGPGPAGPEKWTRGNCDPAGACMMYGRSRYAHALLDDGRAFVFGGCAGGCNGPNELGQTVAGRFELGRIAEMYDPKSSRWQQTPAAARARADAVATTLTFSGNVLVCGGDDAFSQVFQDCEAYDLNSGFNGAPAWRPAGETPRPMATMVPLADGRVLGLLKGVNDRAWLWSGDAWTAGSPLAVPRDGGGLAVLADGRVLLCGGQVGGQATPTAEAFDPRTNQWGPVGAMQQARTGHALVALPDGRALAAGGCNGGAGASAELFDPRSGRWTQTPSMTVPRCGPLGVATY